MFKYIKSLLLVSACIGVIATGSLCFDKVNAQTGTSHSQTVQTQIVQSIQVLPLSIVNSPKTYLNKNVTMNAKFDKFSTLGLDYKPAFKSSEDYITFLIKRDDTSFNIPLSEMKLFIKRDLAEKFIDLKTDDEIKINGTVFSDALGDAWIDVKELSVIKKAPESDNK